MEITTILDSIDLGAMALPEFQRGYVWNRNQVRELMNSLYRRYPVGGLLVWATKTEQAEARGNQPLNPGHVKLILDGQQRVTSLYGIVRGTPPPFFEGNALAFTDLYFNLEEENFEFYGPVKMRDNPFWISVTDLMQKGLQPFISHIFQNPTLAERGDVYISRLTHLLGVKNIKFHIEEVTGADKNVDVVVDIFNRVNSGGTKLSKGDLALARVCAEWADARQELRRLLKQWHQAGFYFQMDWVLRNVNTVLTGEALFTALKDVTAVEFAAGLKKTEKSVNYLLNIISGRLGLDHDRVLGGRYAFPIMTRYITQNGGHFRDAQERDKLLYWYVHSFLWGRFAGSTESVLNKDLGVMEEHEGALDRLIEQLRHSRGDLIIRPGNFDTWSLGARFYPMLYLLTRVGDAQDWDTGLPLRANLLGKINKLQIHHIFPKSRLYDQGHHRAHVNALANYCFLTQGTNLSISNRYPQTYFPEIEAKQPGALASQWIPMDENLWRMENYLDFLAARRELLAKAANAFLDGLLTETPSRTPADLDVSDEVISIPGGIADDTESDLLISTNIWVTEQGLPEGEMQYELRDGTIEEPLALLDLAWPEGIQTGLSEPVALLIDEEVEVLEAASAAGFRCFTDIYDFRHYVEREIMALTPEVA
ncbi:MAG TPA: DUF262 domain-containing protein [Chloroflexota bacterium]|nr:DUF262 domain-containing protein [Chloroflexota bacterium]